LHNYNKTNKSKIKQPFVLL